MRARECLGEKERIGMLFLDRSDAPLPEGERLGMRVIDAKQPHTLCNPEVENPFQRRPQLPPLTSLEVQRVDILIFLGRILCILNRPIGSLAEPLWVLAS